MKKYGVLGAIVPLAAGFAAACSDGGLSASKTVPLKTVEELQDPETCNECHQDHFKEWSGSMHAYASTDPVFRAMNARGQSDTHGQLGDFCVKCHAPLAVAMGKTTDGMNLDSLPQKFQGVTCYFCHNVKEVGAVHNNNSLVLANDQTMRGGIKGPLQYGAHVGEYSTLFDDDAAVAGFDSSTFCGSCHDIVVPAHFSGAAQDVPIEQTFAEWKTSVFAAESSGQLRLNCTSAAGCHADRQRQVPIASPPMALQTMPTRSARHRHNFPAIDTALTDFPEKDAQLAAVKDKLSQTFRIQICADASGPKAGSMVGATGSLAIDVENLTAGHYLPSGASQDRRFWLEVHAYKGGKEIMGTIPQGSTAFTVPSGVVPDGTPVTSVPGTWVFYDQAFKADGSSPAHMFWDIATTKPTVIRVSTLTNGFDNVLSHPYIGVLQPERVTVTIWIEAIGQEVIDDLIMSGQLDMKYKTAIPRIPVQLISPQPSPTMDGRPVTFDWDNERALAEPHPLNGRMCLENTQTRAINVTPPTQ